MRDVSDEGHEDGAPPILRRTRGRLTPRRVAFKFCKFAGVIVALAVVCAGVLALRLQQGPIEIDGLGQKIAGALHDRFGDGLDFDLGQTSMLQRGFGPTLAIDRLVVSGPDRQTILLAPKAEVSVDPIALVFGKVSPKRLEVFDVTLRLVLLRNGALAVAAGDGTKPFVEIGRRPDQDGEAAPAQEEPAPGAPTHRSIATKQASAALRQLVDILTDPHSPIAAVDRLGITRGTLVIEDQMTGAEVVYKDLDLGFDKAHGVTKATLSAIGPNGRWTVTAAAEGRPGGNRRFGLKGDNLSIDEAQLAAGSRSLGVETDMPIAFSADIGLSAADALQETSGSFELGPGFVRMDDPDQEPMFLTTLSGAFQWNGATRTIEVGPLRYVEAAGTHFTGGGQIKPPVNEGDPWSIDLATTEPGLLAPDRKDQRPQGVERVSVKARLFPNLKTFMIDRMVLHGSEGGVALAGAFDWIKGPHVKFGARIEPTSVAFAQRVWPAFMAATVRAWIVDHFEAGRLTEGTIQVDYDQAALKRMRADRAPPDKSVSLDFKLQNGRLRYLDGVPPIDHVDGIGHITGRTSRFAVTSGTIDASGRTIDVSDGQFFVPNTNRHPTPASLTAHLSGSVEAVTDIISRDALKPYASLPLDATTLHGKIEGTLEKALLLGTHGDQPDEPLRVDAKVTDFVADRLIGQESLEEASLAINVDRGMLKAAGQGRLFGGPATFEIDRTGAGPPVAQIAVTLDDAARQKLGLSAVPGLSGPMTAHVNANLGDTTSLKAQVDLDLAKTSVAVAYLGLTKPAGKPGKISFLIEPRDGRLSIDQLVVDIATLQARGSVDLAPDYGFQGAHFASFKVSPGDDMRLDVVKGDDTFKLTIRGSTIDARPFLKGLTSTPAGDATPLSRSAKAEKKQVDSFKGFDIDMKTGILTGFNKEVMNAVDLKLSKRGAQYRQFAVHGRFGSQSIVGSMGAAQRLKIEAADAGALVSFIDLYKHMEGGALTAAMQVSDDALAGNLEIHDFVLRDEPAIRSLVAQSDTATQPGQNSAAKRVDAGAVDFRRLKVDFERAGSRLELRNATMYGNEIGLSVDGWLDYVHDRVAMNGTFVPAYAFNNIFAQIPVFGLLLGGKSNEGLFAITFRIGGAASSPALSINPLSAITPGFLRNIFGVLDGAEPTLTPSPADPGDLVPPSR